VNPLRGLIVLSVVEAATLDVVAMPVWPMEATAALVTWLVPAGMVAQLIRMAARVVKLRAVLAEA
jgi:hypothetical protein